ncbi:MAG: aminodeoxychorismate synthase component I [Chromatiales bacterium]|nr:aminodeoxychorismate synthase component I [Chromatiales bacterium]
MSALWIKDLEYQSDSTRLFDCLVGQPGAIFLDSGSRPHERACYDILAAAPSRLIHSKDGITTVTYADGRAQSYRDDPFAIVRSEIAFNDIECDRYLPFHTGAIGYFAYDLGRRIEKLPQHAADADNLPELMLGIYDWAVITDHALKRTYLIAHPNAQFGDKEFNYWQTLLSNPPPPRAKTACLQLAPLQSNMDRTTYMKCFNAVKEHIYQGNCYQINLAQRFAVALQADAWQLYRRLRLINSAPYSAYLDFGEFQVLSISPERFLDLHSGCAETNPIKGTRPRHRDPHLDKKQIEALSNSAKDKAENLMIVDLLRNDFGKSCMPGSIIAEDLFTIQSFDNVHHMVSSVCGILARNKDALHLLKDCFPGGSITGAPKLRAMEIIEQLEPHRRGVYCGAIGYLSRNGNMVLNIAIRTAVYKNQQFVFYGGGGIVSDSDGEAEYQETIDKVSSMMDLLKELASE